ncbi:MAG: hypothetical protein IT280_09540 [Ignavibacteria bacterium]|nr:hypothetical protein [Ignavibacteria bacterium]
MLKNKAIEILRTFNDTELKQFTEFVNSPFHNKSSKSKKLLDLLKNFAPSYDDKKLSKEYIYSKLYPGKKYNDVVLRILFSDLLKLSEEYLSYKNFVKSEFNVQLHLLEELKDRKLFALFTNLCRSIEKTFVFKGNINPDLYYNLFRLSSIKMDFKVESEKQVESENEILEKANSLTYFFLSQSLGILQEIWEQGDVLNKKFSRNFLEKFLTSSDINDLFNYLNSENNTIVNSVKIYLQLYLCSQDLNSDEKFKELFKSLKENINLFDNAEKYNILIAAESCAISRTSINNKTGYNDLMEIYHLLLEQEVIKKQTNRIMQMNLFRNIFYTAVILKKYTFAQQFIKDYSKYLDKSQRENMEYFTSSVLCFEQKLFDDAMISISKIKQSMFVYKFDTRVLQIKIYYETGSFELIPSVIDSFTHFLKNNKIVAKDYKIRFNKFLKYTGYLVKNRLDNDGKNNESINVIFNKLKKEDQIVNYNWLLSKYNEYLDI